VSAPGEKLRSARERLGWDRDELARRAGITAEHVAALEDSADGEGREAAWEAIRVASGGRAVLGVTRFG
jgi:transcriptional regulator with XRE-family HTH domain